MIILTLLNHLASRVSCPEQLYTIDFSLLSVQYIILSSSVKAQLFLLLKLIHILEKYLRFCYGAIQPLMDEQ